MFDNDIWKHIATSLGSVLITVFVMWFTLVRSFITEEQVNMMINTQSPYVQDRQILLRNVRITEQMMDNIVVIQKDGTANQFSILGKLDTILEQVSTLSKRMTVLEDRVLYMERKNKPK
jgi:hypothetical protein